MPFPIGKSNARSLFHSCVLCLSVFGRNGNVRDRYIDICFILRREYNVFQIWNLMRSCGMRFWQKLQASYDQQHPVQPRKLRPAVQILKSSLAFLFENKNAKFSHLNLKRVWNLLVLKTRGSRSRECEGEGARFLPRCRTLATSLSHSRILEPRVF